MYKIKDNDSFHFSLRDLLTQGVYVFTLDDAKERIDYGVANGKLTIAQAEELLVIAETHATEAPLTQRFEALAERVEELTERVGALDAGHGETDEPDKSEEEGELGEITEQQGETS